MHTDLEVTGDKLPAEAPDKSVTKDAILAITKTFETDDEQAHDNYRRRGRKNELYWNAIQDTFWSDTANDWRLLSERDEEAEVNFEDADEYNTVINIYRAYGESIIAALTAGLPNVRFYP